MACDNGSCKLPQTAASTPPSLVELLRSSPLVHAKTHLQSSISSNDKRLILVYFSASWCPPCAKFSPLLSEFAGRNSEDVIVIYCGMDRDESSLKSFVSAKNFLYIPFPDALRTQLPGIVGVSMIPTLLVLSPEGKTVTDWGRSAVMKNPGGCVQEWKQGKAGVSWLQFLKPW